MSGMRKKIFFHEVTEHECEVPELWSDVERDVLVEVTLQGVRGARVKPWPWRPLKAHEAVVVANDAQDGEVVRDRHGVLSLECPRCRAAVTTVEPGDTVGSVLGIYTDHVYECGSNT